METRSRSEQHCEHCGQPSPELIVHHPKRLGKLPKQKAGPANVITSGQEQQVKLLCPDCHKQHHPNGWNEKQKKN